MPRKVILLLCLVGFVIILLIGISLFGKKRVSEPSSPEQQIPSFQSENLPRPSIAPLPTVQPNNNVPFSIIQVIPENDPSQKYLPVKQVAFYFSQNIRISDLKYSVTPQTRSEVITKEGYPNMFIISPYFAWTPGVTTITILKDTRSQTGASLSQDYIYQVNTGPLEHPGL